MTTMYELPFSGGSAFPLGGRRNRPGNTFIRFLGAIFAALLTCIFSVAFTQPPVNVFGGELMRFDEVKQLVDIADVLDAHGFDGSSVAAGGKILCPLPWHPATEPGFSVVPGAFGEVAHCYGCGQSMDVFQLLAALTGMWDCDTDWADLPKATYRRVLREVAHIGGLSVSEDEYVEAAADLDSVVRRHGLERVVSFVADVCNDYLLDGDAGALDRKAAWARIKKYGFTEETVEGMNLGLCPLLTPGAEAKSRVTITDTGASLNIGYGPEHLYDWRPLLKEVKISEEDAMGSGLFTKQLLDLDCAEDTDNYKLVCVLGGRLTFPYIGPNFETLYLTGRVLDGKVPIVPFAGHRGNPKDMPAFVKALKNVKSSNRRVAMYLRQCYSKFHKPFAPTRKPWVYPEAVEPLMCTPPHLGKETIKSGWEPNGDLVIAEGAPDLVSCYQLRLQAASPVTIRVSNANMPMMERLARRCNALGKRLIWVPDNEENGSGMKGAISTAAKLHRKGLPAQIATIRRAKGKIDLNEYAREIGHQAGMMENMLSTAQPPDIILLRKIGTKLSGTLLEALQTPPQQGWKSVLAVTTAQHWKSYLAKRVAQRFEGLDETSKEFKEVE